METNRELQKHQQEALFDNNLAQLYLSNNKAQKLAAYLNMQELRLQSGMTAEEIDAVKKRAELAYEAHEGATEE